MDGGSDGIHNRIDLFLPQRATRAESDHDGGAISYQALGDAFGRAGADHILKRGLEAAEAVPEARVFSPRRLLATTKGLRL